MKQKIWILLPFLLCGCSSYGSFQQGNIQETKLIQEINRQSEKGTFQFMLLNETKQDAKSMKDLYQMNEKQAETCSLYQSVLTQYPAELLLCQSEMEEQQVEQRKEYFSKYVPQDIKHKRITEGKYDLWVIGEDCDKVFQYIMTILER